MIYEQKEVNTKGGEMTGHRRNHHTTKKNQNTMTTKTMYHSQRQPCRAAMLFIRRKVPESIPPVSANASFWKQVNTDPGHTREQDAPSGSAESSTRALRSQCRS